MKGKKFYYILSGTKEFKKEHLECTRLKLGEQYLMIVSKTSKKSKQKQRIKEGK